MSEPLKIVYDQATDIVSIDGVLYHASVFRGFARLIPTGEPICIANRDDGVLIFRSFYGVTVEDLEALQESKRLQRYEEMDGGPLRG